MSILVSQNILNSIRDEISRSTESFLLISAYCKLPLVKYFDECITNPDIDKKLIVRFRLEDIKHGTSDLDIYPYCKEHGWKLYFRLDLHAKTYVFDRLRCVIGSANATSNGLNIGGIGNYEMATACELTDRDVRTLDLLLLGAVEMNDSIYIKMCEELDCSTTSSTTIDTWSQEIVDMFVPDYSLLFSEDFPNCQHPMEATLEDLIFLNLHLNPSLEDIKKAFTNSKCYNWLLNLLKNHESKEMYFGAITAKLHNVLLNDPKPYRKDVKQLLSNLLGWIDELKIEEIKIDRPNYSQRVRYIETRCNGG